MVQQAAHLALLGAAIVAALMFALWIVHLLIRNAAVADAGWAAGLATLAFFYAAAACDCVWSTTSRQIGKRSVNPAASI